MSKSSGPVAEIICNGCGKKFKRRSYRIKELNFCSSICYTKTELHSSRMKHLFRRKDIEAALEKNTSYFIKLFLAKCLEQQINVKAVCERAGINIYFISKTIQNKSSPSIDNMEALFNVLGYTLKPVRIEDKRLSENRAKTLKESQRLEQECDNA